MMDTQPRRNFVPQTKSEKHYRWKFGGTVASNGYVKLRVGKGHPLADPNGYAYEHRVIWTAAGYPLLKGQIIHHINGNKTDNRICNLEAISRAQHNRHHNAERGRRADGTFKKRKESS